MERMEEQRKTSVSTFWIAMFFVVVIPLLLLVSPNIFVIMGFGCFAAAALRLYWAEKKDDAPILTPEMRDEKIKEAFEKYSSPPLAGLKAPVRSIQIETSAHVPEVSENHDAVYAQDDEPLVVPAGYQPTIDTVRSSLEAIEEHAPEDHQPVAEQQPLQPRPIVRVTSHFHDMIQN